MREELRRRLPRTRGWGPGLALAMIAIVAVIVWLVWRFAMSDTPMHVVADTMEAARRGDTARMGANLTPESLEKLEYERWIRQLTAALGKPEAKMGEVRIVGDDAIVEVAVPHRGGAGAMETTNVAITAQRTTEGWKIDLQTTMASVSPQFWLVVASEE